jgi:hypothetical protein
VRTNALRGRAGARAFSTLLDGLIARAELTVKDTKVTPSVRQGARDGIRLYRQLQDTLDVNPSIPPLPKSCLDPKVVPTVAAFETIAKKAQASDK